MSKTKQELLDQISRLLDDGAAPTGVSSIAFKDVWARYFRAEGRGNDTADDIDRRGKLLLAFLGDRTALEFTVDLAEEYRDLRKDPERSARLYLAAGVDRRRKTKPRPATINRELATARRALQWALEQRPQLIPFNPLTTVRLEKEDNVRNSKVGTPEDLQRLLAVSDRYLRAAILLFVDCGPRRMEVLSLQWSQLSSVRSGKGTAEPVIDLWETKNGERRRIGLTKRAHEALVALPRLDRYVFVGREPGWYRSPEAAPIRPETFLSPDAFLLRFKRACRRAGVTGPNGKPLTIHDLRHTFVYFSRVNYQLPERSIMKQGGWKTRSAFDRYGIGDEEERSRMYEQVDRMIAAEQAELG